MIYWGWKWGYKKTPKKHTKVSKSYMILVFHTSYKKRLIRLPSTVLGPEDTGTKNPPLPSRRRQLKREDTAQRKRTWNWRSGPCGADLCVCSLKGPEIRVVMRAKEELYCISLTDAPLSGTCTFLLHWPGGPVSGPTQWNHVLGCVDTRHEKQGRGGNLQSLLRTLEKCQIHFRESPSCHILASKSYPHYCVSCPPASLNICQLASLARLPPAWLLSWVPLCLCTH